MSHPLLRYYEAELSFLREMGAEFAEHYPAVAKRLQLEEKKCEDPHVERLIEAFALVSARIHHKIDSEFPEITEALLQILYPHYLRPIPSMCIAQFGAPPGQSKLAPGHVIDRGAMLSTESVKGSPCLFRTAYPVALWPFEIAEASLQPVATLRQLVAGRETSHVLRIELRCQGGKFSNLRPKSLRFYLDGSREVSATLHELIFNNARRVLVRNVDGTRILRTTELPKSVLADVGFEAEDGLLPYSDRSFLGYRHLQEYFSFPNKFFFFDLNLRRARLDDFGDRLEILIELSEFEDKDRLAAVARQINPTTFRLGCTPAVNLFSRIAEPIRLTQATTEYRVVPDVRNQAATEVFSIDRVRSLVPTSEEAIEYHPLYSARHAAAAESGRSFWHATRRSHSFEDDEGTEVYISFANLDFQPALPDKETVTLNVTCTNRNLPGKLPFSSDWGYLRMESGGPARVRCLAKFTDSVRPPLRQGLQWRLISHLTLNHLSLVGGRPDALQEILRLYDFADQPETKKLISGITAVSSQSRVGRIASEHGIVFGRGLEVDIEFDEEQYVGVGFFLLATVLERFLSLYNSINSFSELVIRTKQQRSRELKRWPPRAGDQILL